MNVLVRYGMVLLVFALTGCATSTKNPQDPLENFNRPMFGFNDKVDQVAIKPAATAYKKVVPGFMQTGVGNFFGNISDVSTAMNNLLQARVQDGASDLGRVVLNSTVGIVGLFDVATPSGLPKHDQDFGQTLGRWGVKAGPYLVLPLIGPTTMRDAVAMPVDLETDLWSYKYPVRWRNTGTAIRLIDRRAYILDSSTLIEDAALDRYEFVRDAYLQRRQSKIYTGDPRKLGRDDDGYNDGPTISKPTDDDAAKPAASAEDAAKPAAPAEDAAKPAAPTNDAAKPD